MLEKRKITLIKRLYPASDRRNPRLFRHALHDYL